LLVEAIKEKRKVKKSKEKMRKEKERKMKTNKDVHIP